MDRDLEDEVFPAADAEQLPADGEVAAAADGKEFRQALDEAEEDALPPVHRPSSFFLSRGRPMMATISITTPARITTGAATMRRKLNIS